MSGKSALFLCAAVALAAALFSPAPARASFTVCNDSSETINTAVSHHSAQQGYFISEGWWRLTPGECKVALGGDLDVRYVYVYAESNDGSDTWSGSYSNCVNPTDPFTLYDSQNRCPFIYKKFREVDTGDYKNFTYTFK